MPNYLDSEILEDRLEDTTVEDAQRNQEMVDNLNYLIEEGFIELEENDSGEIRAYPVS